MTKIKNKYLLEIILVGALLLVVAYFGFNNLTEEPHIWFDDSLVMQLAKNLAVSGHYGVEIAPNQFTSYPYYITVGFPVVLPAVLAMKIFGVTIWAARFAAVMFMLVMALAFYLLSRAFFGRLTAFFAMALLISFPPFYGNGKALLGEVPGLAYLFLAILIWQRGHEEKNKRRLIIFYVLAGLLAGFSVVSKPSYLLLIPGFALMLFLEYLEHGGKYWRRFAAWAAGFFVAAAAWFAVTVPRPYSVSIFKDIFSYYANSRGDADLWKTVSANLPRLVTDGSAIFFLVLFVVVLAAFFIEFFGKRISIEATPLYVFVFLSFLWWLKTPGYYRYFFPAEIILLMFFPASLKVFLRTIFGTYLGGYFLRVVAIIALIVFQFYWLIFNSFSSTSGATKVISILNNNFKQSSEIFVLNSPEFGFGIEGHNFSQYFYYNPVNALGENALLRAPDKLPQVVVYNTKNAKQLVSDFKNILDDNYRDYYVGGSDWILVRKDYAR